MQKNDAFRTEKNAANPAKCNPTFLTPLPTFLEIGHPLCPHQTKAKYTDIRIQISCDVYYCCAKFLFRTVFPCV